MSHTPLRSLTFPCTLVTDWDVVPLRALTDAEAPSDPFKADYMRIVGHDLVTYPEMLLVKPPAISRTCHLMNHSVIEVRCRSYELLDNLDHKQYKLLMNLYLISYELHKAAVLSP